jgi:hypothetical protein
MASTLSRFWASVWIRFAGFADLFSAGGPFSKPDCRIPVSIPAGFSSGPILCTSSTLKSDPGASWRVSSILRPAVFLPSLKGGVFFY